MKCFIFLCISIFGAVLFASDVSLEEEKKKDLSQLDSTISLAKTRIEKSSRIHASDFLQLLPTVSMSRRSPYDSITNSKNETYIGVSINSNQIGNISDRFDSRAAAKLKALRQIDADRLVIRKLIERKYLLKDRIWKYVQIRRSLDNPVEVASLDEKIDEATVRLQEAEMDIEKALAGIEYLCVDVER
jgi:hypothetical protein